MCGRYVLKTASERLAEHFNLARLPQIPPRYNIAPGSQVTAVILRPDPEGSGEPFLDAASLRWGLVPSWAKDEKTGYKTFNARSETAMVKPSFRDAFHQRRCLIPADGFYEWSQDGSRTPWYITQPDEAPMAFAGIWDYWRGPQDEQGEAQGLWSCSILTRAANSAMQGIHHRMPVRLAPEGYQAWLDPDRQRPEDLMPLIRPWPEAQTRCVQVSDRVNSSRVDEDTLIVPVLSVTSD